MPRGRSSQQAVEKHQESLAGWALTVGAQAAAEGDGRFPERLEDLTPEFIIAVPRDPFDGKPIRLKQTDGGPVVYSIGPDLTDQGGSVPFDRDKKTGDIAFKLSPP